VISGKVGTLIREGFAVDQVGGGMLFKDSKSVVDGRTDDEEDLMIWGVQLCNLLHLISGFE